MEKAAKTDHEIHDLLQKRWSPRAFDGRALDEPTLRRLIEAARWAPSCYNEQPWRLLIARRDDPAEFERMLGCLDDKNRSWAKEAGALMISVARTTFTRNDQPNRHAYHDVGLAVAQLTLQATALGLGVHQMAGFSPEEARHRYEIPAEYDPVAALAVGYAGDPDALPPALREKERAPRERRSQQEIAFAGRFGEAF